MKRTSKLFSLLMALCLIVTLLAACSNSGETPVSPSTAPSAAPAEESATPPSAEVSSSPSDTGKRTVVDALGNEVEIPDTINSICATYPAADAIVLMLGGGDKLVATTSYNSTNEWFIRMLPKITTLPQPFADLKAGNLEEAMSLAPDIIITSGQSNLDAFNSAGLAAVAVNMSNIDDLKFVITLIGEILGGDAVQKAADLIAYYDANISLCSSRTDSIADADRPTVFYAAGKMTTTEGNGSIVKDWTELAGGVNVAAENGVDGMFIDITQEQLMQWDPDVIICRDAATKDEYYNDPTLSALSAVKNDRVYVNPKSVYVWCVRSADEAIQPLWAATVIQPELFSDIDMVEETRTFHNEFYGLDLTDDEINSILYPTAG